MGKIYFFGQMWMEEEALLALSLQTNPTTDIYRRLASYEVEGMRWNWEEVRQLLLASRLLRLAIVGVSNSQEVKDVEAWSKISDARFSVGLAYVLVVNFGAESA